LSLFRFSAFLRLLFESKVRCFSCLYKLDSFKDVICRRFKDSTVEDQPISPLAHEVRFAPKADKSLHRSEMTRCAITGREQMQQPNVPMHGYSITSSARASSAGGRVRASAFAVFRLIRSPNLVG
jgi:hypothetical protein